MTRYLVILLLLAIIVIVAAWYLPAMLGHAPVSVVLRYQVDPAAAASVGANDVDWLVKSLVVTINDRLNGLGEARALGGGVIEVRVYGDVDQVQLELIKRRITTLGDLEFRITADPTQPGDRPIIEEAKLLPPNQTDVMLGSNKVAEWVAYSEAEFGPPDKQDTRVVKRVAGNTPQALVLMDPMNVTGEYLTSASKAVDERGGPTIDFSFSAEGAHHMGELTEKNKPDPVTGAVRYLGIIFDKRLVSAPSIRMRISDRGRISGGALTEAEVDLVVDVLHAGRLPLPIREVSEQRAAK